MKNKVVIIVQARLGSTRLPGKILKPLNGYPVLQHVLERCAAVLGRDSVICAGVDKPGEEPVQALVESMGMHYFAGSEEDVLSRYYLAAKQHKADWVVRVTSDCPLLDPAVCRELVEFTQSNGADFGITAGWPHGLDCEIVKFSVLERAVQEATLPEHREHVTLWVKYQPGLARVEYRPEERIDNLSRYRWVLDYPEDYQFLAALFEKLAIAPNDFPGFGSVMAFLGNHPEIAELNQGRRQDWAKQHRKILQAATDFSSEQ